MPSEPATTPMGLSANVVKALSSFIETSSDLLAPGMDNYILLEKKGANLTLSVRIQSDLLDIALETGTAVDAAALGNLMNSSRFRGEIPCMYFEGTPPTATCIGIVRKK